jgi:predicted RNA binding protein YcfA (HicA-like mRNA interferase family)
VITGLERLGFVVARQKGSHVQMKHGNLLVTVPVHAGTLAKGTLKSIL